eukprot:m.59563 g.59563  ORF g.59563 m.59563 type:complete len:89 (-) comp49256_c0_seq7:231-497(-)
MDALLSPHVAGSVGQLCTALCLSRPHSNTPLVPEETVYARKHVRHSLCFLASLLHSVALTLCEYSSDHFVKLFWWTLERSARILALTD